VLRAFGAAGPAEKLGGFTGAWRAGELVLKPSHARPDAVECEARVLASVPDAGFRLQRPRRARDGSLLVDGWIARDFLHGSHATDRWTDLLHVGDRLDEALRGVSRADAAPMLDGRTDPWGVADRIAWDEEPMPAGEAYEHPVLKRLADARRPVTAPPQLVHGDLSGNVLFAENAPPAVIDFSPYFRPAAYAVGVLIADAVVWHAAPLDLLDAVARRPEMGQCLLRALLFRHLTGILLSRAHPSGDPGRRYEKLIEAAIHLA
jgi:uncharacterized protein (TIGR02569 family)